MVSFRGQKKLGPRPDRSPLGVEIKISDEHPHPFHMRSPPPPGWNLNGQSTLKPHFKAYAVFCTREKKPHARSENLNVMWGSPQAISFPDSIIDNCSHKAVVKTSVKSMDEISVTIQMMAPKQDCPALDVTKCFSLFYIWSSSWKFLEFIRVNRLNLHDYGLYQVRKTTRRLWIQTSCVYKQTTKAQWQFHCQFLMTVYLVPFLSRRWIMYICR